MVIIVGYETEENRSEIKVYDKNAVNYAFTFADMYERNGPTDPSLYIFIVAKHLR